MRTRPTLRKSFTTAFMLAAFSLSACGGGDQKARPSNPAADRRAVQETVRQSVAAENAKDSKGFAALWTDRGLGQYDVGSRQELEAGRSEGFGEEKVTIVSFTDTRVTGNRGSTTVDVLSGEHTVAKPIFRAKLAAIRRQDRWLLDGFEFVGSPPPPPGTPVLNIDAQEYVFVLDKTEVPTNVAFKFSNKGKEPHEISLFKAPSGTQLRAAQAALENVNGEELNNVPAGYQADHISFAPPGMSVDLTFAEPLAAGEYFLVCYLPQGGFNENDEPVNPQGAPHVKLGMISKLTVR